MGGKSGLKARKLWHGCLALAAALLLGKAGAAQAASSYYVVKIGGSDANPCTLAQPCSSVARGMQVAADGDTILISEGIFEENLAINKRLMLRGAGMGKTIIDGNGLDGIELAMNDHLTGRHGAGNAVRDAKGRRTYADGLAQPEPGATVRLTLDRSIQAMAETALAVVLVIGAGLLIRSLGALQRVDVGFDPAGLLTFQLYLPDARYPSAMAADAFYASLLSRIEALPGVQSAAAMSGLPPLRNVNANDTEFEGVEQSPERPFNVDYYQTIQGDYVETMGIPLVEGRAFGLGDDAGGTPVALVNETLAKRYYPDLSPIGRRIRPMGAPFWLTIVGVVKDVKQGGLAEATGTELYFNNPQVAAAGQAQRSMNVVVRTSRPPLSLSSEVRAAVRELDPSLPLARLQTMEQNVGETIQRPRFLARLLGIFAALALVLAAVGTYGVLSYAVAERSHEIGIRMAMGARAGDVQGMVLKSGLTLAGAGLVLGVLGAIGATRLMRSLLFGVSTTDVTTFLIAPIVLGAVGVAACLIPAWRATRVDPAVVLRQE